MLLDEFVPETVFEPSHDRLLPVSVAPACATSRTRSAPVETPSSRAASPWLRPQRSTSSSASRSSADIGASRSISSRLDRSTSIHHVSSLVSARSSSRCAELRRARPLLAGIGLAEARVDAPGDADRPCSRAGPSRVVLGEGADRGDERVGREVRDELRVLRSGERSTRRRRRTRPGRGARTPRAAARAAPRPSGRGSSAAESFKLSDCRSSSSPGRRGSRCIASGHRHARFYIQRSGTRPISRVSR